MSTSMHPGPGLVVPPRQLGYNDACLTLPQTMPRPVIKLLVTDLDNTLYDWVGFFAAAFRAMIDEAVDILDVDRDQLLDELRAVHQRHHDSERPWSLAETASTRARWPGSSLDERIARLDPAFHAFNRVRKDALALYPGVRDTLTRIQDAGVPIVGHTEASVVNASGRVARLGLDTFLSRLYAADSGDRVEDPPVELIAVPREIHKPDPRILLEICAAFDVNPAQALYVGDSIAHDVGMAQQAGMHAAWASYGTRHAAEDWSTLTRVTHWTQEDVARAEAARARFGDTTPEIELSHFSELLTHYEFRAPDAASLTRSA